MQGLRKHWCQYYDDHSFIEYDEHKKRYKKIIVMRCMICGNERYEYEYLTDRVDREDKHSAKRK